MAELRQLTHRMLRDHEAERQAISRDLHDDVVQVLTGISVLVAGLVAAGARTPGADRGGLRRAQLALERAVTRTHRYARDLRPAALDVLGLVPALRAFVRELPVRSGLRIRVVGDAGLATLGPVLGLTLFRVAQEAIVNVVRHARARAAVVRLSREAGAVRLVVKDNGRGFPARRSAAGGDGLGLVGMRERVTMAGGTVAIETRAGQGTTVRVRIPLRRPGRKAAT